MFQRLSLSLFLLTLPFSPTFAQSGNIAPSTKAVDSLLKEISSSKSDTAKIRQLLLLANIYDAADSVLIFQRCWEAVEIAKRIDDPLLEGKALNMIGKKYFDFSYSDRAIAYFEKSMEKFIAAGDKSFQAKTYMNMGNAYHMKSKYDKSLELYLKAMRMYEEAGDKRGVGKVYVSLSNVYNRMGQYEKQKEALLKGLAITEESQDLNTKNAILINLGNYYGKTGDYPEALKYYREGAKLGLELNNIQYYSNAIGNIGAVFAEQGISDSALLYMKMNLEIDRQAGDGYSLVNGYTNIASVLEEMNRFAEALKYTDSALVRAKLLNYPYGLKATYEVYSDVYHAMGNDSAAFRYLHLYISAKDSLMSADMNEKISSMSALFEQEKQSAEIETLKEKNKNQNITTMFVAVAGFLVLLLAIMLYKRNQLKTRANEQLGFQNAEIQLQKEIIEEKNRDITDSIRYAKRIQENFLPSEKYIEKSINRLRV